jgi:large repetitive protein
MKNRTFTFGCLLLAIVLSLQSKAQTYNLHWGSTSWVGPTYSKTITNIGGSGIDAGVVITNTSPAGNVSTLTTAANDAFQYNSPIVGAAAGTNWFLPGTTGNSPLVEIVDWATLTSTVTTVITFTKPVNNISFYVGDMDRSTTVTYIDRFSFTGKNGAVAVSNPIVTKFQATKTGADTVLISGNTAYGNSTFNANAATNSIVTQGATVYVQFGNPITELKLLWDQGPGATGNPVAQAVAIGDIAFSKVIPELPPTADNFLNTPMLQGNAATAIPGLTAADLDGTIVSYSISTVPLAGEGVLTYCSNGTEPCTGTVTTITAGTVLTPAQMVTLKFDPTPNFTGTAVFTFTATDNYGNISNTATYQLPVIALPPVSNNIMENSMPNTNGATAIQVLNSSDVDGTIASYNITTVPPTGEGVLSYCSNGTEPCTGTVTAITAGTNLTVAQMATLKFAPAAGFIGNAIFNYNAVDNSGNTSNTANYTIPVTASATTARPPLADNITAQTLNNSLGATSIPPLQANDLDGTVASYTISTIPSAAQGILTCCGGTAVTAGQVLTPAQAATLQFDPAPGFTGTASFNYTATDNSGLVSNTAAYNLPVINTPPTVTNINTFVPFSAGATLIPSLSGADADGTIANYTIATIPTPAQGALSYCSNGTEPCTGTVTTIAAGTILTPAQAATLKFDPATGFSGIVPFTYSGTDNSGNVSAAANYNVTIAPQPPVSNDITNAVMPNTNGATAITALSATDADGTVASYTILSVPDATQGILSIPCPATPAGATCTGGFANLTAAVLTANPNGISLTPAQAAALRFDPAAGFTGLAAFKYGAVDNSGLISNISTYTVPVSGTGNIPPMAKNILAPAMPNTNGPTAVPSLIGTDADGTIASYTLNAVPSAAQGVLSIPCPATPTGATCTGSFANLTPAVLAANTTGIVLTPAQAAGMRFDPLPGFSGNVEFAYFTTDNTGASSAGVVYTIPVTSLPPVATAIAAPSMSHNNGATLIPGLIAADADGTIANYTIESIPAAAQGVLSYCSNGTEPCTGTVTAITAGTVLTPAQMATLKFDPAVGYTGNVVFNYHATDNSGLLSNSTTYTVPVSGMPPVSNNVLAAKMFNSNGPTVIPGLSSSDADGSISNYVINSIPPASQGVLSYCSNGTEPCTGTVTAIAAGTVLTAAQIATLKFDPAAGFVGNATFNYAAYDNNGNISNIAAYTIPVGTVTTLPISLLSFSGQRNGVNINLYWKTENEVNADRFEVEYSTDGINFNNGGLVSANNLVVNNYQFALNNFTQPVYYIRLKTVDKDGRFKQSAVITIKLTAGLNKAVVVMPNPVTDKMHIRISSDITATSGLRLINNLGQVVYQQNEKLVKGENLFTINDLQHLSKGIYSLQVIIDNEIIVTKVYKH